MDADRAAAQLEVIRTLMERTALYRRSLIPATLVTGGLGAAAAVLAFALDLDQPRTFGLYWMAVAGVAMGAAFLLMRRQAMHDGEPFWSPPARRVLQAALPAFTAGLTAAVVAVSSAAHPGVSIWWLPVVWMVLYGCALNAAGFFMPRGIRLFGWLFVLAGCALGSLLNAAGSAGTILAPVDAHLVMGGTFGGFHALYGLYLLQTRTHAPPP